MRSISPFSAISLVAVLCCTQANSTPESVRRLKAENKCPGCNLRNDDLSGFNLKGADLKGADLENTSLKSANLNNTDLRGVKGLTLHQVKLANGWQQALYDAEFRKQLGLPNQ